MGLLIRLDFGYVGQPQYKVADGTVETIAATVDSAFASWGSDIWDFRAYGSGSYLGLTNTADGLGTGVDLIFSGTFNMGVDGGGYDGIDLRRDYLAAAGVDMTFVVSNLMPNTETKMFFYGIDFYNAPFRVQIGTNEAVLVAAGTATNGSLVVGTTDASGVITGMVIRALDINPDATELDIAGLQIYQPDAMPWIKNMAPIGINETTVSMNGYLAATGGAPANVWLFWGTNDCGTDEWPNSTNLGVMSKGALSNQVSGLTYTNTTYYYRYYASNSNYGAVWAAPSISVGGLGDTDGDGMHDGWELFHGLNPLVDDASQDPDVDGLTNLQEYQVGTDPGNADTDGDGMSDYVEVRVVSSDPNVVDFNGEITTISTTDGSASTNWLGSWTKEGSVIYARERSGYVDYIINAPSNGNYALAVEVTQHNQLTTKYEFDFSVYVDGVYSGRRIVDAPYGTNATGVFFLQTLTAGDHAVRIVWNNVEPNTFMQINSLKLQVYGGPDNNTNGIVDWLDHRLANVSEFTVPPAESLVSPICLEGESWYQGLVSVSASYVPEGQTQQVVVVKHGVGVNWYADVLLSPDDATIIEVSDQNGSVTYSNDVTWTELNVLTYTNSLMIRSSSSLLLTCRPAGATNGSVTIEVYDSVPNLVTSVVTSITAPVEHLFSQAGNYTVTGIYSNETLLTNDSVSVKVVSGSFAAAEAVCVASESRTWDCPSIPPEAVIEHDGALSVTTNALAGGGLRFTLLNQYDVPLYMVARLGAGGPILDNAKVSTVYGDNGSYWRVVDTYSDGSQLVEVKLQLGYVPPDIQVQMHIFAGGVTFDDGTLDRTLTAADFDASGVATVFFIRGVGVTTSICHTTKFYQGSTYIGGN